MPEPYDYTSAFASVPAFGDSLLAGLKNGYAITDLQNQRAQQARDLAVQQQKRDTVQALVNNPNATADDYAKATLIVPELHEQFKQAWDTKSAAQQQNELSQMVQWSSAIQNGEPKIASDDMRSRADAIENTAGGPTPESKALRAKADQVDANPNAANFVLKSMIAANPKGKAAIDGIVALGGEQRAADLAPAAVRKANADAGTAESDNALKNYQVTAQKAAGLAKAPGLKPSQVMTFLQSEAAAGRISPDELDALKQSVPSDPKALPDFLGSLAARGLTPDQNARLTTPDANAQLSARTQVQTTRMNNATQLAVQDRIAARQDSKGDAEPTLDADTLSTMAQQYLAGDKSVMQNLGRGAQGAANIVALRQAITKEAKAQGLTGPQIAAKMADYQGLTAGMRTSANISARVENAISEAKELAPLAIAAGREVSRSGFLPFGKAEVMFNTQTNDPALKKFVTANNGLVSAYAGAMARGQKPTVSDYDHARDILSAPQSQQAYEATVNQMFAEMAAASKAPQNVREHLRGEIGGGSNHGATPTAADHPADISALLNKYGKK
jgi:hypothetical protein